MGFKDIGIALAILRRKKGLTQAQLAERCGMSRPQVSRYEAGRQLMKLETLERVLGILRVEPDEFFRFLGSLDNSGGPRETPELDHVGDRSLAHAFRNLHAAIDALRQVLELAVGRAGVRQGGAAGRGSPASAANATQGVGLGAALSPGTGERAAGGFVERSPDQQW